MADVVYTTNPAKDIRQKLLNAGLPVRGVSVQGLSATVKMTRALTDDEKTTYAGIMGILASSIIVIPTD